ARPIPSQSGELILEFNHESSTRCVVAFEFLPGSEPSESDDLCEGFEQLGAITARLHQHVRRWALPKTFTRKRWDYSTMLGIRGYWGDWRDALGIDLAGRAVLAKCADTLEKRLAQWGTEPDRFGLIHADLRLANLLVDNNNLAVIDFDDCGFGWFLYDFAAAISFIETSPQIPDAQAAWIEGYRSIKALSKKDVAAIPMFVMLRRQLLTAWIASHSETPTAQELGTAYTEGTVEMAERWLSTNRSL
ncbi:MAG: phosphotransferase, partial [Pseudomonadota bacterium]